MTLYIQSGETTYAADNEGRTPLHYLAAGCRGSHRGEPRVLGLLMERVENPESFVNQQDEFGHTALHYAAMLGNTGLAIKLLRLGAKLDIPDNDGRTPLHWAAIPAPDAHDEDNWARMSLYLLQNGAMVSEAMKKKYWEQGSTDEGEVTPFAQLMPMIIKLAAKRN